MFMNWTNVYISGFGFGAKDCVFCCVLAPRIGVPSLLPVQ
jgi:hypothetical protein